MKKKKEKFYLITVILLTIVTLFLAFILLFDEVKEPIPKSQGNGLSEKNIKFLDERIIIDIPEGYNWASVENWSITSMYPTVRQTSILIALKVNQETKINLDDIIIFDVEPKYYYENTTGWMHRVIKKGIDPEGEYFYTKGDSNKIIDPFKVRRENVTHIVVAIIY